MNGNGGRRADLMPAAGAFDANCELVKQLYTLLDSRLASGRDDSRGHFALPMKQPQ